MMVVAGWQLHTNVMIDLVSDKLKQHLSIFHVKESSLLCLYNQYNIGYAQINFLTVIKNDLSNSKVTYYTFLFSYQAENVQLTYHKFSLSNWSTKIA